MFVCRFDRHSNLRKPGARTIDFIINSYRVYNVYILYYILWFVFCFDDRDDEGGDDCSRK